MAQQAGLKNIDQFEIKAMPDESLMQQVGAGNLVKANGIGGPPGGPPGVPGTPEFPGWKRLSEDLLAQVRARKVGAYRVIGSLDDAFRTTNAIAEVAGAESASLLPEYMIAEYRALIDVALAAEREGEENGRSRGDGSRDDGGFDDGASHAGT